MMISMEIMTNFLAINFCVLNHLEVHSIRFLNLSNNHGNTGLITSTKPSEGKTTVTTFIAKTLSDLGNKVLLIDADMRKPSIHKILILTLFKAFLI